MIALLILTNLCFLLILFYYQKKDLNYIGYTTVLALLFGAVLVLSCFIWKIFENENKGILFALILSNWIIGSVLIYITSQLTLAFEKISKLSRHIAIAELESKEKK